MKKLNKKEIEAVTNEVFKKINEKALEKAHEVGGKEFQSMVDEIKRTFKNKEKADAEYHSATTAVFYWLNENKEAIKGNRKGYISFTISVNGQLSTYLDYSVYKDIQDTLHLMNINQGLRVDDLVNELVERYTK